MARQNGQFTFQTPTTEASRGDDTSSAAVGRIFTAIERCTVVEFGAIAGNSSALPSSAFAFRLLKRTGGAAANDVVVPAYTAANAAEGGPAGNTALTNGIVTNTAAGLTGGKALRAYCEVTLDKGDAIVVDITTAGGASSTAVFYVKAYPDGAGMVELNDVDSN